MFDNTVWYSEGSTHEADVTSLRLDDMDPHGYSDPIMFFGYAHKRNDQTNIINAGVAPTGDKFSIVDVNLDNDCDGISNWEDPDDNAFDISGGGLPCQLDEPCLQNASCGAPESTPPVASTPPTTPPTTEVVSTTSTSTSTTTSTTTTEQPAPPLESPGPDPEPPEDPPEDPPDLLPETDGTTTTTSEDLEPPAPTVTEPPPTTESPAPTTTEPLPTTTTDPDPPEALPPIGNEECDCDNGMPWWFWFIIGNMSWMTVRYIIKHMKEAEEEKEEVASLLDGKEDEEVE